MGVGIGPAEVNTPAPVDPLAGNRTQAVPDLGHVHGNPGPRRGGQPDRPEPLTAPAGTRQQRRLGQPVRRDQVCAWQAELLGELEERADITQPQRLRPQRGTPPPGQVEIGHRFRLHPARDVPQAERRGRAQRRPRHGLKPAPRRTQELVRPHQGERTTRRERREQHPHQAHVVVQRHPGGERIIRPEPEMLLDRARVVRQGLPRHRHAARAPRGTRRELHQSQAPPIGRSAAGVVVVTFLS